MAETLSDADWWWPSPDAFNDLEVEDNEDGWLLSAPDDTELSEWLAYWSQSEEHHKLFQEIFLATLIRHAESVIENYGQDENLPERGHTDSEQAEDVGTGLQPQHESGSDS
jgi:hypothetical protein